MQNEILWCWDNVLKKGETLLISSHSNTEEDLNLSMLTGQIALSLSNGQDTLLSPNHYKIKVLYISTYMNKKEMFNFHSKQIGGEGKINLYNDNFMMLYVDSEDFSLKKEELKKIVSDMEPDLIVFDNITRLLSPVYEFTDIMNDIKEISGLKSKIISNCFHPILQHKELSSLQLEAAAEITLKHISLFEGFSLLFKSKYNHYTIEGILRNNDQRKLFAYEKLIKYKGINKNKVIIDSVNNVLDPLS